MEGDASPKKLLIVTMYQRVLGNRENEGQPQDIVVGLFT
jgi:hypothetical protein